VNENPWRRLPDKPPYVLPEDEEKVLAFNVTARQEHVLDLDLIPEPFVGRPDAPVVLLGNNSGVKSAEAKAWREKPAFTDRMRNNLLHRLSDDFPFLYLDPDPSISPPGKEWWRRKLEHLCRSFGPDEDVAWSILARSILAVEFFPYVSHRYRHGGHSLPSQQYSLRLVRNALERGAVVVLTRGHRRWEESLPELNKYPRCFRLKEVQQARIGPGNFSDREQYEEIIRAIRAALP
jgi:hypothetical protein